jgi:hypothetical protein
VVEVEEEEAEQGRVQAPLGTTRAVGRGEAWVRVLSPPSVWEGRRGREGGREGGDGEKKMLLLFATACTCVLFAFVVCEEWRRERRESPPSLSLHALCMCTHAQCERKGVIFVCQPQIGSEKRMPSKSPLDLDSSPHFEYALLASVKSNFTHPKHTPPVSAFSRTYAGDLCHGPGRVGGVQGSFLMGGEKPRNKG